MQRINRHDLKATAVMLLCFTAVSLLLNLPMIVLSLENPNKIGTSGTINYGAPPSGTWLAWTDCEQPTTATTTGLWQQRVAGLTFGVNTAGGATSWKMDSTHVRTGSHSVMATKPSPGSSTRFQYEVYPSGLWEREWYTSIWYYVPTATASSQDWWEWWSIFNTADPLPSGGALAIRVDGLPNKYWSFAYGQIQGGTPYSGAFHVTIDGNDVHTEFNNCGGIISANAHEFPLDRWFKLEVYAYRHPTRGIWKVWITDPQNPNASRRDTRLLFSIENAMTSWSDPPNAGGGWNAAMLIKLYGVSGSVWWDDIYIADYNAH